MKKALSFIVAALIVCMSFIMVSVTAPAEDVAGPFVTKNDGYPFPYAPTLDQSCEDALDFYTVTTANLWAQTFTPSMTGELASVDVQLFADSLISVSIRCEIRATTNGVPDGTWLTYEGDSHSLTTTPTWYSITLSTKPYLTAGMTYAIVLKSLDNDFKWSCLGTYSGGDGFFTPDGGSTWSPNDGEDFGFRTHMRLPEGGIKKVAWHSSGEFALGVTGVNGVVYRYGRGDCTWSPFTVLDLKVVMYDIVFDPQPGWDMFYIVGKHTLYNRPWAYEFHYDPMGGSTLQSRSLTGVNGAFYGVERSNDGLSNYKFLAVGLNSTGQPLMTWMDKNGVWTDVSGGVIGDVLYDACWDRSGFYYAVGEDSGGKGVMYRLNVGSSTPTKVSEGWGFQTGPLYAMDWNDNYTYHNWGILAGGDIGSGSIWKFNGSAPTALFTSQTDTYYDLDFFPFGPYKGRCHVVGGASGAGIMCTVEPQNLLVARSVISSSACRGIALKGPSSPSSGIIVGSGGAIGFYPSALNQDTSIIVNAVTPKLYWIGFNDTALNNRLDQQVSVDADYLFTFKANYSQGWAGCEVYVQAWYDQGLTHATGSGYPALLDDSVRNQAFTLYWTVGAPDAMVGFPASPELEIATGAVTDLTVWAHPLDVAQDHHEVRIPVNFGKMIRSAGYGGMAPAGPQHDQDPNIALNNPFSWDFNIVIRDSSNPTAFNRSFGEFGIEKMVSVAVTGNPSGSAPPGTTDNPMSMNSRITYSANVEYWVNVSIPHLYQNGLIGATNRIGAGNVSVQNTHVSANAANSYIAGPMHFPKAENTPMNVWGLNSTALAPAGNGTVSAGPWVTDYNAAIFSYDAFTELQWWVTIMASVPEGVYIAIITVTVDT